MANQYTKQQEAAQAAAQAADERDRMNATNHLIFLDECRAKLKAQQSPYLNEAIDALNTQIANLVNTKTHYRHAAADLFVLCGNPLPRST